MPARKTNRNTVYIFLTIAVVVFALYYTYRARKRVSSGKIPKIIWTYWDKDPIPDSIKFCIKSWRKHNPNYQINILTRSNFMNYANIPDRLANNPIMNDSIPRFTDLVRLFVIAEHGGVWCDAGVIMSEPLDTWLNDDAELNAFTIYLGSNRKIPAIESWFFAAPPKSPFVLAWKKEFCKLADYNSVKEYIVAQKALGTDLDGWKMKMSEYLAIHIANLKLMMVDKYPLNNMNLHSATDGPLKYLAKNDWDLHKGLLEACNNPEMRRPFLKLRGGGRELFEKYFNSDLSNSRCGWI